MDPLPRYTMHHTRYLMNFLNLLMTMTTVRMIQIQKLTLKLKVAAQIRQFSVETQSLDILDRVKT